MYWVIREMENGTYKLGVIGSSATYEYSIDQLKKMIDEGVPIYGITNTFKIRAFDTLEKLVNYYTAYAKLTGKEHIGTLHIDGCDVNWYFTDEDLASAKRGCLTVPQIASRFVGNYYSTLARQTNAERLLLNEWQIESIDFKYLLILMNRQFQIATREGNTYECARDYGYLCLTGYTGNGTVTVPEFVELIKSNCFRNNLNITSICIKGKVYIGEKAFADCKRVKQIVLECGAEAIESGAFSGCESLENIEFRGFVNSIKNNAFVNCSALKNLKLPTGIITVHRDTVRRCQNLKTIEVPLSVASIENGAFVGCHTLETIIVHNRSLIIEDSCFIDCGDKIKIEYAN